MNCPHNKHNKKKHGYQTQTWQEKAMTGTLDIHFLNEGSLEVTLTVPLNRYVKPLHIGESLFNEI